MKLSARAGLVLLPLALIVGGACMIGSGIRGVQGLGARRLWPRATATILTDQVVRSTSESDTGTQDLETHQLRLRFRVGGRDYEADMEAAQSDLHLQKLKGRAGENFTVLYNPLNPQEIHALSGSRPVPLLIFGALMCVLGFAFIIAAIQRREISGRR